MAEIRCAGARATRRWPRWSATRAGASSTGSPARASTTSASKRLRSSEALRRLKKTPHGPDVEAMSTRSSRISRQATTSDPAPDRTRAGRLLTSSRASCSPRSASAVVRMTRRRRARVNGRRSFSTKLRPAQARGCRKLDPEDPEMAKYAVSVGEVEKRARAKARNAEERIRKKSRAASRRRDRAVAGAPRGRQVPRKRARRRRSDGRGISRRASG